MDGLTTHALPSRRVTQHRDTGSLVRREPGSYGINADISTGPAGASCRQVRVFATGNGSRTDAVDAHSVAIAAVHAPNLRRAHADPELLALGPLTNRRDELGRLRTQTVNRAHPLMLDLPPGGAKHSCPPCRRAHC
ncbi:hypothetical protein ABZ412_06595 [Nocardia sp. NPDC005746]|uniref:hypothetical protein n=1 Tax=Nocardia sp. NPDC005746 TaxID=3157062 RepID=UPI0033E26E1B